MISVITPSFRQLDWLRLCIASVADQTGVEIEHLVQDAGTEGLDEETMRPPPATGYRFSLQIEKDSGMYDAINRGLRRASGEVCAYLNCDEQYLPNALARVAEEFARDPAMDVLLAGSLVVDQDGNYSCSRPALAPSLHELRAGRMYNLSSGMFFRRSLVSSKGYYFDPGLRIVGDRDWLRRVVEGGAHIRTTDYFTSVFSDLGTNLALSESASGETARAEGALQNLTSFVGVATHRLRRLLAGHYWQHPFDYSIYTLNDSGHRQLFHVERPTGVWHSRL